MLDNIIKNYDNINGKKAFKNAIKEINCNKKLFLIYSNKKNIPLSAIPHFRLVLSSKASFLHFCYQLSSFYNNEIEMNEENIKNIIKFVVAHEIGHVLDNNLENTRTEFMKHLNKLMEFCMKYNFNKNNTSYEIDSTVLDIKKNLINREVVAWNIGRDLIEFKNDFEIELFDKIKNYALATYNSITFNSLYKHYNLEVVIKLKRKFSLPNTCNI